MALPAIQTHARDEPQSCGTCGRVPQEDEQICPLCGERLDEASAWRRGAHVHLEPVPGQPIVTARDRARDVESWSCMGVGVAGALVLGFVPIASFMGWFLAALMHEMGHAAAAWALGMPSVPAISLAGHAAAVHGEPLLFVALIMWGLFMFAPRCIEHRQARIGAVIVVAIAYPLVAFTSLREVVHLLAGHLAELAFACVFLWRGMTGGFTSSRAERVLYASIGWYLVGTNLALTLGLLVSPAARSTYASNGSFGLTNDYLRLAPAFGSLFLVAALMTLIASCAVPLAFLGARAWRRA